mgnify:CR=1 FL=1
MGYTFNCDHCQERFDHAPPFMGEFSETFLKTSDSPLVEQFDIGQTVTLCLKCSEDIFG